MPAIILERPSVVISPLLSLMEDQRIKLEKLGVKACCYSSSISDRSKMRKDILNGEYRVIYITPETVINSKDLLQELNKLHGLSVVAIDEAHCVSLWGNTFRSSYLQLSCLKEWMPKVPILALTATATQKVEKDMITSLKLKNPLIIRTSSNRHNLSYFVHTKTDALSDLKSHIGTESSIIYCQKRKPTEQIAELLQKNGAQCEAYHAGLSPEVRNEIHNDFLNNKIHCIVATISYGMGIDKSDIRKVIHYGCPKDIESYYQETGRAGRDGQPSQCHVYFSPSDFYINQHFLKDINDDNLRQHHKQMMSMMENYLYTTDCRRKCLIEYFDKDVSTEPPENQGESGDVNSAICCDNCVNAINIVTIDVGHEVKCFLELTQCFSGKFGKSMFINAIRGANIKKMPTYFRSHEHYGIGKKHNLEWWKTCVQHLINQELICEQSIQNRLGSTVCISKKGLNWLDLNQFNPKFVVEENAATSGILSSHGKTSPCKNITKKNKCANHGNLTETESESYTLFQNEGKTISEIAKIRELAPSTIEGHLANSLEKGLPFDLNRLNFSETIYNEIMCIINDQLKGDSSKLAPIKALCRPEIGYGQIRLCIAIGENRSLLSGIQSEHLKIDEKHDQKVDGENTN